MALKREILDPFSPQLAVRHQSQENNSLQAFRLSPHIRRPAPGTVQSVAPGPGEPSLALETASSTRGEHQAQKNHSPVIWRHSHLNSRTVTALWHARLKIWPPSSRNKLWDTLGMASSCVRDQPHPPVFKHQLWDTWSLQPEPWTDLCLPVGPCSAVEPVSSHWLVGISLGISWTPIPTTSETALALEPLEVL